MNSHERKELRYQRRQQKRTQKRQKFLQSLPSYEEVFTFQNLYNAFWACRKEVSWKPSIQIYQHNITTEITKMLNQLHSEQGFRSDGFIEFNICERGKMRHIRSVNIKERVVQRCFCDNYLVPLLTHNLIYDNGASLRHKGVTFSLNRMKKHLQKYYKKHKTNQGYILLFDFSNYFGSISHEILYQQFDPLMLDEKCRKLFHHLVDVFGDVGLGLGSQVSQVSAVAFLNKMDHFFENQSCVDGYARYMDDGYVIVQNLQAAQECKEKLFEFAKQLGVSLNEHKIKIIKLTKTFTFLKKRFLLTPIGKVVVRLNYKNVFKHRKRIKKLYCLTEKGVLTITDLQLSHLSWKGQVIKRYNSRKAVYDIDKQIRRLLNGSNSNHASYKCSISKGQ